MYFEFLIFIMASSSCFITTNIPSTIEINKELEDEKVVNETIEQYGHPKDFKELHLPGSEFASGATLFLYDNKLESRKRGRYTLRIRTIVEDFSYNGRYEKSTIKKMNKTKIPIVKGQFGEHFLRKSGGYYLRTIGYILDEIGYRQFLIDLSIVKSIVTFTTTSGHKHTSGITGNLKPITSTVLATLIGGNSLG